MSSASLLLLPSPAPPAASFSIPGSKSYTNRALVIAAQAGGRSRLLGASASDDSAAMIAALERLGVTITSESDGTLVVDSTKGLIPFTGEIDVGPAGTTMRFLTTLLATVDGADVVLTGSARMRERPISDLVDALRQGGADIQYVGTEGCPPLRIKGKRTIDGRNLRISGSTSSQFVSSLLLSAPRFAGGLQVFITGDQISKSYLEMTVQSLRDFGVDARSESGPNRWIVDAGAAFAPRDYEVECDLSGASYFWALAAVTGGSVTVKNVNRASAQGDLHFVTLLNRMGCEIENGDRSITVQGPRTLKAIECDMTLLPDTAQTLAVVAACAKGSTTITGLRTLRVKETDRIKALQTELRKVGIVTDSTTESLTIHGGSPGMAHIATYEDHRMAMSFAVLGAREPGIVIDDPHVVSKSFPTFWSELEGAGVTVRPVS